MTNRTRWIVDWIVPLVLLTACTVVFWVTDLDMMAQRAFYEPGIGWEHKGEGPWEFLYDFGVIPAWILAVGGLFALVVSVWKRTWRPHWRVALYLVLAMAIGPGLVVNDVFKKNWGRPRPKDVYEFNGDREFVKVWVKQDRGNGNSFASGHASTGFFLFAPYFVLRRRHPGWAITFLAAGISYGALMGLTRMIQGAHFLSDVVWAFGFVYLTCAACAYLLRVTPPRQRA